MTTELPGRPAIGHLVFSLANVPDGARGSWRNLVFLAVDDAAHELGSDFRVTSLQLTLAGQLILACKLGQEADDVARVVKRAIEMADERHHAWVEREAERKAELDALRDAVAVIIRASRRGQELFGDGEAFARGADGRPMIQLKLHLGDSEHEELGLCADGFRSLKARSSRPASSATGSNSRLQS